MHMLTVASCRFLATMWLRNSSLPMEKISVTLAKNLSLVEMYISEIIINVGERKKTTNEIWNCKHTRYQWLAVAVLATIWFWNSASRLRKDCFGKQTPLQEIYNDVEYIGKWQRRETAMKHLNAHANSRFSATIWLKNSSIWCKIKISVTL